MTQKRRRTGIQQQTKGSPAEAIASRVTDWVGSSKGILSAAAVVVIWAASRSVVGSR